LPTRSTRRATRASSGSASSTRRCTSWRPTPPVQRGLLRRQPHGRRGSRERQPGRPECSGLPGHRRLGSGHRSRHAERREPAPDLVVAAH
jgi:hypothetical protein